MYEDNEEDRHRHCILDTEKQCSEWQIIIIRIFESCAKFSGNIVILIWPVSVGGLRGTECVLISVLNVLDTGSIMKMSPALD